MRLYIALSIGFLVVSAVILASYINSPTITAKATQEYDCMDGSRIGECSEIQTGNACVLTRDGPQLRFHPKCYDG